MEIHLETFSYCNAKCVFCGYHNMTRKKGMMSDELFKKVIQQIAEMDTPVYLKTAHYNEFFLDSRWYDFLRFIDDTAPKTIVHIPTNCSCLTDEVVEKLLTVKTFKEMLFSVYSFNPVSYAELIGLPVETLGLIRSAIVKICEKRPDVKGFLGFSCELLSVDDIEGFLQTVVSLVRKYPQLKLAHHLINRYGLNESYAGMKCFYFLPGECCASPCSEPFTTMTILHNGDVCGCCFDVDGEVRLGNIHEERLIDIWNGKRRQEFMARHADGRRMEIPLCRGCSQPCNMAAFREHFFSKCLLLSKGCVPVPFSRFEGIT